MKGFIDLIFCFQGRYYLIDWKSNFLGDDLTDYATERLTETMWREGYILQYLLYVVACIGTWDFDSKTINTPRHFGGVYYVFLRGVNPLQKDQSMVSIGICQMNHSSEHSVMVYLQRNLADTLAIDVHVDLEGKALRRR